MSFILRILFVCLLFPAVCFSQDTLVNINGEEFFGKVEEIGISNIHVKKDSVKYVYAKKDIFMIKFSNGTREVFKENLDKSFTKAEQISDQTKAKYGAEDAKTYYGKDDSPLYITGGSCCVGGVLGLIPLVIYHTQEPAITTKKSNHPELLQDKAYLESYGKEARNARKKKATNGALIAAVPYTIYLGFMIFAISLTGF
jgi:hypothetical protein